MNHNNIQGGNEMTGDEYEQGNDNFVDEQEEADENLSNIFNYGPRNEAAAKEMSDFISALI